MAPQSYYLTGLSQKQDLVKLFNSFADDINNIVGIGTGDSGYGQNHLVVNYAVDEVTTPLWDELLTSMFYAGRHQGTPLFSPVSTSSADWPIDDVYSVISSIKTDIANIVGNKLNSSIVYMTANANKISSAKTYVDPNLGTPIWTSANQIYYETKVSWTKLEDSDTVPDPDGRRHFFNAGGEIRIDSVLSLIDSSHAQSNDWKTMLDDIAVIKIKHSITEASTGAGEEGYGFSMLNENYQVIYRKGGNGDYSSNQLLIRARLAETSETSDIEIKIEFNDSHPSSTVSGNFVIGTEYTIQSVGTTDFTLIGAADNEAGGIEVQHTALNIGDEYTITSNDDNNNPVDWVALGAPNNGGGAYPTVFTATAVGNAETSSHRLEIGKEYRITTVGSTDFTTLGSASNIVGTRFTATGQSQRDFMGDSFVVGKEYEILTVGNTDFTVIGAANNNVGTVFTATGVGDAFGTGTARLTNIGTADYVATGTATTTATKFTATGPGTGTGTATSVVYGNNWSTPPYSGTWIGSDYVAGNLQVTVDEFIASDSDGVELDSPGYSNISQL